MKQKKTETVRETVGFAGEKIEIEREATDKDRRRRERETKRVKTAGGLD